MEKYELNINNSIIPFIATVLHPALKMNYFAEHQYSKTDIRRIKNGIQDYFDKEYDKCESFEDISSSATEDELNAHMFRRSKRQKLTSELEKYLQLPLANKRANILEYWKVQRTEFPLLSKMAMDILPAQAASVAVERDFSQAGRVVAPARSSLQPKTITASMCCKSWMNSNQIK